MIHGSWTYCESCKKLAELKLFPRFANSPIVKPLRSCDCVEKRYLVPEHEQVDDRLKNRSSKEVRTLRPLDIHTGECKRMQNG